MKYNKCVVAFAIMVDKGKDTKAGFDKKIVAALSFLQTYIDKHAAFFAINGLDSSRPPIKEKADLPAFQVILRRYFEIPSKWAFNSVNQDGGKGNQSISSNGILTGPSEVFGGSCWGFKAHGVCNLLQAVPRGQHDCTADIAGGT